MTYNIHKGFSSGRKEFVLEQVRDSLRGCDCDIVLLQEIQGEHKKKAMSIPEWPKESQFEYLADSVWPHHAYGKNAIYQSGHHGNAILSKYPFAFWENINVSRQQRASRSLLHGMLSHPAISGPLHVICLHLGLFEAERKSQIEVLTQRIKTHVKDADPLIIGGDFNDWRGKVDNYFAKELGLKELFLELRGHHAKSFPSAFPVLSLDRIYFRGLTPRAALCLRGLPWKKLSDHLPLYAEFSDYETPIL